MALTVSERLGYDIKATEIAFMTAKTEALRSMGLTVAQYAALLALRDNPGISGAGIARACLVTPQASAATLKTLEAKGLVVREQDDWNRNSRPNRLSDEGQRLIGLADSAAGAVEQRMYDALAPADRDTLRRLLGQCRAAIAENP
ncbi:MULTISPECIES: MarR family winged helix-turn-helix transcriptional regulator [Streptomyces]|uniref:MarR family winged helix-turn-helix transcriptional regulator n=1 Tax=Streptomyces TaxID=1883 RepID=UPI001CED195B|nr:MarR family transcriptional regulator [Streptomyces triticiradicis]